MVALVFKIIARLVAVMALVTFLAESRYITRGDSNDDEAADNDITIPSGGGVDGGDGGGNVDHGRDKRSFDYTAYDEELLKDEDLIDLRSLDLPKDINGVCQMQGDPITWSDLSKRDDHDSCTDEEKRNYLTQVNSSFSRASDKIQSLLSRPDIFWCSAGSPEDLEVTIEPDLKDLCHIRVLLWKATLNLVKINRTNERVLSLVDRERSESVLDGISEIMWDDSEQCLCTNFYKIFCIEACPDIPNQPPFSSPSTSPSSPADDCPDGSGSGEPPVTPSNGLNYTRLRSEECTLFRQTEMLLRRGVDILSAFLG